MPLASWRSQHDIMGRHRAPIRLLEVLAFVPSIRMVGLMKNHGQRPVVRSPHHARAGKARAFGEATGAGKEIDAAHGSEFRGQGAIGAGASSWRSRFPSRHSPSIDGGLERVVVALDVFAVRAGVSDNYQRG